MSTTTMTGINTAQHIVQTLNSPVRADEDNEDNLIGPEAVDELKEIETRMVSQVYGERSLSLVAGSFFPSAKSEADSGSREWNETNPDSPLNISSLFPSNKSETDDSSPEFSRSNSYSITSIFLPATSPVDSPENNEIIVRNRSMPSYSIMSIFSPARSEINSPDNHEIIARYRSIPSYCHFFPPYMSDTDSNGSSTPNHQLSIPSYYQCFPPDRSDTDSYGSSTPMQFSIPSLHFSPNKSETINSSLIVARSRSQAGSTRRVTPTTLTSSPSLTAAVNVGVTVAEKPLANGDLYIGGLSGNAPHGSGKYVWTDGCMYEGEWRRGKAYGKGKFSWPSRATYEGYFKSGRMEGLGTFIGSDGDTYRGSWSSDRKHGYGEKRYAIGDFYKGYWKRNVQDGQGRYVWRNGNEYEGEWKNGVISGLGVLLWANGNRYSGKWENGVSEGNGVFTWPDSSCYVGSWNKDLKIQQMNGTFYPGNGNLKSDGNGNGGECDNLMITMRERSSVDGARGSVTERNFPEIYIWESDGEAGDITCDIINNVEASMYWRQ